MAEDKAGADTLNTSCYIKKGDTIIYIIKKVKSKFLTVLANNPTMFNAICARIDLYEKNYYKAVGINLKKLKKVKFKYLSYLGLNDIDEGLKWYFRVDNPLGYCDYYIEFTSKSQNSFALQNLIFVAVVKNGECQI